MTIQDYPQGNLSSIPHYFDLLSIVPINNPSDCGISNFYANNKDLHSFLLTSLKNYTSEHPVITYKNPTSIRTMYIIAPIANYRDPFSISVLSYQLECLANTLKEDKVTNLCIDTKLCSLDTLPRKSFIDLLSCIFANVDKLKILFI